MQSSSQALPQSNSDCMKLDGVPRRLDKLALIRQQHEEQRHYNRSEVDDHVSREDFEHLRRAIFN